jgi:hypothetical protein
MGLLALAGFRDRDLFGGKSLPVFLNERGIGQKPKPLSEADKFIAQSLAETRVQVAQDRLAMLQKLQERQNAIADAPIEERTAAMQKQFAALQEAELQLRKELTND